MSGESVNRPFDLHYSHVITRQIVAIIMKFVVLLKFSLTLFPSNI